MIIPSIDIMDGQAVQLIGGRERALEAGDPLTVAERFAVAGDVAVIACLDGGEESGYWTSDITIVGAARGLLAHLTG